MLIEFAPEIFASEANGNKFNFLYNLCYLYRRYDLFIDLSEVQNSPLYQDLREDDKKVIQEYFIIQSQSNEIVDIQITDGVVDETYKMDLDEAYAYLNQPVYIVLENSHNDKHFLESVVKNYSKRGKKIKRHLERRFISYLNGGGCTNIVRLLEEKLETFVNLRRSPQFYLRAFVLIDSDSEYPDDVKEERLILQRFLVDNNIAYHFLVKREMENYLPEEVYDTIPDNQKYIEAFKRLSPIQKDYLDIENGFNSAVNFEDLKEEIKTLFLSVSISDRQILRAEQLNIANFKVEFPKLFRHALVTQASLEKRIAHQEVNSNELSDILDKINQLL